jgi:hypothetical protein
VNVSCRATGPLFEPDLATGRMRTSNECALAQFGPEVARVRVDDRFTRIVAREGPSSCGGDSQIGRRR